MKSRNVIFPLVFFPSQMTRPPEVGIKAMEIYFPSQYVDQTELEAFDGVSAGKYTVGLGQIQMGFCSDREDINSIALTVTQRLMERIGLDFARIGFLAVGTETLIDKSKSTKTVLMQLFAESGNYDVEGVDCKNACYGGTAALFHAVDWVESSSWDGRLALVVAADIAVYAKGPARCTGGAGAVALLIGPNATLTLERGLRTSVMRHSYDFFKPDLASEYPTVDGPQSIHCYLSALDHCYRQFCAKVTKREGAPPRTFGDAAFCCFHAPFGKLVQKSFARLAYLDARDGRAACDDKLERFLSLPDAETYANRELERAVVDASFGEFATRCQPSLLVSRHVGNMYTPSLYGCLASLLGSVPTDDLAGVRVLMFSYGSGLAASMYALRAVNDVDRLSELTGPLVALAQRLDARRRVSPEAFDAAMARRESRLHMAPLEPADAVAELEPGAFYLTRVDEQRRRSYERKPVVPLMNGDSSGNH